MSKLSSSSRWIIAAVALAGGAAFAWWIWHRASASLPAGFVTGNGRIEATEIDISTKLAGRIDRILVREGDFVLAGQPLATMRFESLQAQRDEAQASLRKARNAVAAAEAQVVLRESNVIAAQASLAQRAAEFEAAQRRLARSQSLAKEGATPVQVLDDDRAAMLGAQAAIAASNAQIRAGAAAVKAAQAELVGMQSAVDAAIATVERIDADIRDSELSSPRDGRVQLRLAQPGEVLGAGGRVLNVVDLSDVYMTFFVPNEVAGRIAIGTEVRIVLDAAPGVPVPATVSFVAATAQFTPKTVETASERQKLMFRVKATIAPELLRKHLEQVKTGLPGVAWVRLDPQAPWPADLASVLVE